MTVQRGVHVPADVVKAFGPSKMSEESMLGKRSRLLRQLAALVTASAVIISAGALEPPTLAAKPPPKPKPIPPKAVRPAPKPPPPKPAPHKPKPPPVVPGALQVQEADALRQSFIALAEGNHDYNGHRWKAMNDVKAALVPLDNFVLKHGAAELKAKTRQGQTAVAEAEAAAKKAPTVSEPQPASDALLGQAGKLLQEQVRPALVANKQPNVLRQVDAAIGEIKVALKVR